MNENSPSQATQSYLSRSPINSAAVRAIRITRPVWFCADPYTISFSLSSDPAGNPNALALATDKITDALQMLCEAYEKRPSFSKFGVSDFIFDSLVHYCEESTEREDCANETVSAFVMFSGHSSPSAADQIITPKPEWHSLRVFGHNFRWPFPTLPERIKFAATAIAEHAEGEQQQVAFIKSNTVHDRSELLKAIECDTLVHLPTDKNHLSGSDLYTFCMQYAKDMEFQLTGGKEETLTRFILEMPSGLPPHEIYAHALHTEYVEVSIAAIAISPERRLKVVKPGHDSSLQDLIDADAEGEVVKFPPLIDDLRMYVKTYAEKLAYEFGRNANYVEPEDNNEQ